jgi:ParB family chromosome partitioning protein
VAKPSKPTHLEAVEKALYRRFGAQVAIKPGRKRGKIEITYQGEEDLQRLLGLLNG